MKQNTYTNLPIFSDREKNRFLFENLCERSNKNTKKGNTMGGCVLRIRYCAHKTCISVFRQKTIYEPEWWEARKIEKHSILGHWFAYKPKTSALNNHKGKQRNEKEEEDDNHTLPPFWEKNSWDNNSSCKPKNHGITFVMQAFYCNRCDACVMYRTDSMHRLIRSITHVLRMRIARNQLTCLAYANTHIRKKNGQN